MVIKIWDSHDRMTPAIPDRTTPANPDRMIGKATMTMEATRSTPIASEWPYRNDKGYGDIYCNLLFVYCDAF